MNTIEQNVEREMTASGALEIQRMMIERQNELMIFLSELIEEIYEINPCSELLRKWHLRLLKTQTSRGTV